MTLQESYQAGIVSWVAIWAVYGQGLSVETFSSIATFGVAYMSVIILESLVDRAVLEPRLFQHGLTSQAGIRWSAPPT